MAFRLPVATQPLQERRIAKLQGKCQPEMFQPFDKLQIATVQQILDGERMNLPLMEEVTKKAKNDDQPNLLAE